MTNHILLVAREVFFELGLAGATTDIIAQRAGMSKPTLYRRYKDKFELFSAVMQASVDAWAEGAANNPIIEYTTLEQGLRNFVTVQVRANTSPEYSSLTRLIYAEQHRFPELGEQLLKRVNAERINSVVRHIRKFAEIDGIPCRDPESVAEAMRGMVSGWVQVIVASNKPFGPLAQEELIDRVIELLMASRRVW